MAGKEKFYNSLTDRKITDKEYKYVLNVWNKFEMRTMKFYHDMCLKCDVLLLADVFETLEIRIMDYVQVIIWAHQV